VGSHSPQNERDSHPAADTKACNTVFFSPVSKSMKERNNNSGTGSSNRMSERDRATQWIDPLGAQVKIPANSNRLSRKCLVQLEDIDIGNMKSGTV
jgi:hypothetical protein